MKISKSFIMTSIDGVALVLVLLIGRGGWEAAIVYLLLNLCAKLNIIIYDKGDRI